MLTWQLQVEDRSHPVSISFLLLKGVHQCVALDESRGQPLRGQDVTSNPIRMKSWYRWRRVLTEIFMTAPRPATKNTAQLVLLLPASGADLPSGLRADLGESYSGRRYTLARPTTKHLLSRGRETEKAVYKSRDNLNGE